MAGEQRNGEGAHGAPPGGAVPTFSADGLFSSAEGEPDAPGGGVLNGLAAAAIVIAALYFGRDVLMPLALAVLLAFVLSPVVTRLKRWGAPRGLAVFIVVITTLALIAGTASFVVSQLRVLGQDLPTYQVNIRTKLSEFRQNLRQPGMFDQLARVFGTLEGELAAAQRDMNADGARSERPARVEVVPAPPSPLARVAGWLDQIATPVVTLGIVLVFAVLILFDRGDLRDRCLRLLGGDLHRTTDALNEAGRRVSRYLGMQLLVNLGYGIPMAVGLALIGVPGAMLWGLLAAVLRFVPYAGPMIAAVFPITIAFAVDPGWTMLLWVLGLIVVLELLSNNVVEPWLYANSTGLSALSLIMAATFWTAIWGPVGLMLSTPLTVVLLVLGRYLPQLRFMNVLPGNEPPLSMTTRLYQRLLAGDADEAVDLAIEYAEQASVRAFYEDAALPALLLASNAHHRVATPEHRHRMVSGMRHVIDEMRDEFADDAVVTDSVGTDAAADEAAVEAAPRVMCIGGRWEVDSLAAEMVAHALTLDGFPAIAAPAGSVSSAYVDGLKLDGVDVVCLSYFSPAPATHAKYYVRRLERRWPQVNVVLAAWNAPAFLANTEAQAGVGADSVASTIAEAVAQIEALLATDGSAAFLPAPVPDDDQLRVQALRRSGVLDEELRASLDAIAKRAAEVFDCPFANVSLIDENWQLNQGDAGAAAGGASAGPPQTVERALSLCAHVVAGNAPLVVNDVRRDPRFASNPALLARKIRFYAGAPLRDDDGYVLGTLCLLDTVARAFSRRDLLLLETLAAEVMSVVRAKAQEAAAATATEGAA